MAGKTNAKPAKQAKPAKDAAMAETTSGAAEQTVTPPAQEGEAGTDAAPAGMTKAEVDSALFGLPKEFFEPSGNQASEAEDQGQPASLPEGGPESGKDDEAQPGAGADEDQGDGPEEFDTSMWFPGADRQGGNFNPDHVREFFRTAFQGFAHMLIEADVRVRKNGEEVSPLPEDLLAVTLRQDEAVFVTCDGRKFKLKGEKINEA